MALTAAMPVACNAAADGKVRSFVLSNLYVAMVNDSNGCKQFSEGAIDIYRHTLSAEEQKQYASESRRADLGHLMAERLKFTMVDILSVAATPITSDQLDELRREHGVPPNKGAVVFNGTRFAYDTCTNPEDFPAFNTGNQRYVGKIAYGANLNNKSGADDFVNPRGEQGIDNKLVRATGCTFTARDYGDPVNADKAIVSREAPTLIEVSGIDNEQNDNEVTVSIYSSASPLVLDAVGGPLQSVSYDINPDARFISSVHGRIANGELLTDAFNVRVRLKEQIVDSYRELFAARLRAKWNPDGSIQGELHGYHSIASIKDQYVQSTQIGANLTRMSCPALLDAIEREADGIPDAKTKRNTAISSALHFVGVGAFVIHPEQATAQTTLP